MYTHTGRWKSCIGDIRVIPIQITKYLHDNNKEKNLEGTKYAIISGFLPRCVFIHKSHRIITAFPTVFDIIPKSDKKIIYQNIVSIGNINVWKNGIEAYCQLATAKSSYCALITDYFTNKKRYYSREIFYLDMYLGMIADECKTLSEVFDKLESKDHFDKLCKQFFCERINNKDPTYKFISGKVVEVIKAADGSQTIICDIYGDKIQVYYKSEKIIHAGELVFFTGYMECRLSFQEDSTGPKLKENSNYITVLTEKGNLELSSHIYEFHNTGLKHICPFSIPEDFSKTKSLNGVLCLHPEKKLKTLDEKSLVINSYAMPVLDFLGFDELFHLSQTSKTWKKRIFDDKRKLIRKRVIMKLVELDKTKILYILNYYMGTLGQNFLSLLSLPEEETLFSQLSLNYLINWCLRKTNQFSCFKKKICISCGSNLGHFSFYCQKCHFSFYNIDEVRQIWRYTDEQIKLIPAYCYYSTYFWRNEDLIYFRDILKWENVQPLEWSRMIGKSFSKVPKDVRKKYFKFVNMKKEGKNKMKRYIICLIGERGVSKRIRV